jgi:hypothetical protein
MVPPDRLGPRTGAPPALTGSPGAANRDATTGGEHSSLERAIQTLERYVKRLRECDQSSDVVNADCYAELLKTHMPDVVQRALKESNAAVRAGTLEKLERIYDRAAATQRQDLSALLASVRKSLYGENVQTQESYRDLLQHDRVPPAQGAQQPLQPVPPPPAQTGDSGMGLPRPPTPSLGLRRRNAVRRPRGGPFLRRAPGRGQAERVPDANSRPFHQAPASGDASRPQPASKLHNAPGASPLPPPEWAATPLSPPTEPVKFVDMPDPNDFAPRGAHSPGPVYTRPLFEYGRSPKGTIGAPGDAAPPLPPKVRLAGKAKARRVFLDLLGLPMLVNHKGKWTRLRISEITMPDGSCFFVTNTLKCGSFGKVRYAIDEQGNAWAFKELRSEKWRNLSGRDVWTQITQSESIKQEIGIQAQLGRGKTMTLENGKVYTAIPLMDGEVLDALDRMPGDLHATVRREVGRSVLVQMAEGLAELHRLGWVHMDVKLENALVKGAGEVEICDFGLAAPLESDGLTQADLLRGTPGMVAPEVLAGRRLSTKTDMWSLALAFCDVHIPGNECPFGWGKDVDAWKRQARSFERWWKTLVVKDAYGRVVVDAEGHPMIDLNRIPRQGGTEWDQYFNKLRLADHGMCAYVLGRMLNPDANERPSAEGVVKFITTKIGLAPKGSRLHQEMLDAWAAQRSVDSTQQHALAGLRTYIANRPANGFPFMDFTPATVDD